MTSAILTKASKAHKALIFGRPIYIKKCYHDVSFKNIIGQSKENCIENGR